MATESEFMRLTEEILNNDLVEEVWYSSPLCFGRKLRAGKGKATKKNLKNLGNAFPDLEQSALNQVIAQAQASALADQYHGQTDICFGIVLAVPKSTDPGTKGDLDNYVNSICDVTVELFRENGPFDPGSGKEWDDSQIRDLRVISVESWDENWWIAITTGKSTAPK